MRSAVYATEIVSNTARRFAEATVYYPAWLVRSDGTRVPLLLTLDQLAEAEERAGRHPEDIKLAEARHEAEVTRVVGAWCALVLVGVLAAALLWRAAS